MFNEATQNIYRISYDEWHTQRRVMKDMIDQHDIGSAQKVNSPKHLIRAHQTKDRNETPNENDNLAILHNLDLRKTFLEIDSQRYKRDSSSLNYEENDYIEQYKDLKPFL